MASTRKLSMSFSGGEMDPEFNSRIDDAKFQAGAARMRNFLAYPHGPAANRPGTKYVNTCKTPTKKTWVRPFSFSATQTMVLEFGESYVRFHTNGATLLAGSPAAYSGATPYVVGDLVSSGGVNYYCIAATTGNAPPNVTYWYPLPSVYYEIPTPYLEADLGDLHMVQSNDVLTIVHPSYAPRELRRLGATKWTLVPITFGSTLTAPTPAPVATATVAVGPNTNYFYAVTSVSSDGLDESPLSATSGAAFNNLLTTGNYNTITWTTTGATRYNVYKQQNGLFGYIGQTDALTFKDDNIAADMGKTAPIVSNPFSGAGLYPGAVSYSEQRRCFAGSNTEPQTLYMTRSGTESNMNYSLPTRDDDRIKAKMAAREANTIRHLVPVGQLLVMTAAAEWRVTSVNSDAITANSISIKPQAYVGANNVTPVVVNNNVVYAAADGGHVREMAYQYQAGGYVTGDLCLRASHLFDDLDIVDMAFAKAPKPYVWAVSSNGNLLGLTYVPEQQIGAWHRHDTALGTFESCCVVKEGRESALYVVVNRTINGAQTRYIERFSTRQFTNLEDAFFVDCGATYSGVATTTITGLTWLEGCTVSVLGNGAVFPQKVVTGGAITLEAPCTKVHVGLPITADLQTMPLAAQIDAAYGEGRVKDINQVWLNVVKSSGIFVGPDFDNLTPYKQRTEENFGTPPAMKTDTVDVVINGVWQYSGQIAVRQSDPLPLTITSITAEAELGG